MADGGPGDIGTLTTWQLCITYTVGAPPPTNGVWTPITGLYSDPGAGTPYVAGTPTNIVYAKPLVSTTYSVTVTNIVPSSFTLSQTSSNTITAGNSVACNAGGVTTDNSYWRVYDLNTYTLGAPFSINSIQFGIELEQGAAIPIQVGLYKQTGGAFPGGTRTLFYTQTYSIPNTTTALYNAVLTTPQVVNTTDVIVVELFSPATPGSGFFLGSNAAPETGPLYLNAVACGVANPVTVASLGFPNMHGIITINGSSPGATCQSPATLVPVTVNIPVALNPNLPANAIVCTDKVTSFTVATTAGTSPTYQWQVSTNAGNNWANVANNANYSGATTATLTITAPPTTWNGYFYRCVVSGAAPCGSVNSRNALLTVNPLPVISISASPYRKLFPGLRTTLSSTTSPAAAVGGYNWLRNDVPLSNPALGVVSGVGTGTLLLDVDGLGTYKLRVTDVNGCVSTSLPITISDSASGRVFIYPNPNGGVFQVRYNPNSNNVLPRGLRAFNQLGQKVFDATYSLGLPYAKMLVDLRNAGSGVYDIEVYDVNGLRLAVGRVEILR